MAIDAFESGSVFNRTTWAREICTSLTLKFQGSEPALIWSRQVNFGYYRNQIIIGEVSMRDKLYQVSTHAHEKLRLRGRIGYDLFESENPIPDVPAGIQSGVEGEVLPCSVTPPSGIVATPSQFLLVPLDAPHDTRMKYQAGLLYGSFGSHLVTDFERASNVLRMWLRAFEVADIDYTKVKAVYHR